VLGRPYNARLLARGYGPGGFTWRSPCFYLHERKAPSTPGDEINFPGPGAEPPLDYSISLYPQKERRQSFSSMAPALGGLAF